MGGREGGRKGGEVSGAYPSHRRPPLSFLLSSLSHFPLFLLSPFLFIFLSLSLSTVPSTSTILLSTSFSFPLYLLPSTTTPPAPLLSSHPTPLTRPYGCISSSLFLSIPFHTSPSLSSPSSTPCSLPLPLPSLTLLPNLDHSTPSLYSTQQVLFPLSCSSFSCPLRTLPLTSYTSPLTHPASHFLLLK